MLSIGYIKLIFKYNHTFMFSEREEQKQPTPSTSENINTLQPASNIESNEVGYPFQVQINFRDKNGILFYFLF